jgi:membrane protease YdiL (CAAX protease family)
LRKTVRRRGADPDFLAASLSLVDGNRSKNCAIAQFTIYAINMESNVLLFVVLSLVVASIWGWTCVVRRAIAGLEPLTSTPTRAVPWTAVDIFFCIAMFVLLQMAGGTIVRGGFDLEPNTSLTQMPLNARALLMLAGSIAGLLAMVLSALTIMLHTRATWRDLGVDTRYFAKDLRIGLIAFVLLAPPVYALQVLLVQWFPSEHPLVNLLRERPDPLFLGISAFVAVIVAPLTEEYFFRVLFQGWLHRVNSNSEVLTSWFYVTPKQIQPEGRGLLSEPVQEHFLTGERNSEVSDVAALGIWPIFASAIFFSLMHTSHGPDPIPLFLLAVGLGYLYRQTRRVLPCIVVHLLLNVCSLAALILAIQESST